MHFMVAYYLFFWYIYICISKEIRVVILLPIMSDKLLLTIPEKNMNYLLPYVSTVHDIYIYIYIMQLTGRSQGLFHEH